MSAEVQRGSDLPQAARPFVEFPGLLRRQGFRVAPEQTLAFLSAVDLLGARSIEHIRRGALATLAPPPERRDEFDALFRFFFEGRTLAAPATSAPEDDEEMRLQEDAPGLTAPLESDEINEAGQQAVRAEALSRRGFEPAAESEALRRFARAAPARLPRRRARRRRIAPGGDRIDLRRALRASLRTEGEVMELPRTARRTRQRPILLLIDVSGSMKAETDWSLRFAHALMRAAERVEIFTLGTRLTRVTRALRRRNIEQALTEASALVSDWDGGTRLGDALQAYLAVPRFAGFARGALVLVLSDGLERGDPSAMVDAVARLSRRAWRLSWLTPLAADPGFRPETEALRAALPWIDDLAAGGSVERLASHVLSIGAEARP